VLRGTLGRTLNRLIAPFGIEIADRAELAELRRIRGTPDTFYGPSFKATKVPDEALIYLQPTNPRLEELRKMYEGIEHPAAARSLWMDAYVERDLSLAFFRGDNAYVYQVRGLSRAESRYALAVYYAMSVDKLGLFDKLEEDGQFGAYTFNVGGRVVSRDLVDSIMELNFLEQELGISHVRGLTVLDIGAGYGRFAHRLVKGLTNVDTVLCADAIPESSFLCEYYLRFRGVSEHAKIVTLPEVDAALSARRVDLAVNVHSFSECPLTSIVWWLDTLRKYSVKYLMVVPNPHDHSGTKLLSREPNGERFDFLSAVESADFRLRTRVPKYAADPMVQKHAYFPTHYYLFESR